MQEVVRSALMPYSATQMFDVVNDVLAYPSFLPWCVGSEIISATDTEFVARLDLARAGMRQSFSTRNELDVPHHMHISLVEGPFSMLEGDWHFHQLGDDGCKVEMNIRFDFNKRLMNAALGKVFSAAVERLVSAFCERADDLYAR
ncbi:MAG: ubiquinone-binding protein [Gammaproteobacteria bacterium]|nr:ubiquinone-binding protein [Gammaproteobacteria bacterium]|tara:strand:- start:522 stop:956 length:435 start_codon:yes stop_codon:yes gene_type:complete